MINNINAGQIRKLLSIKHRDDIFVEECKTGSTWFHHILILDAWAMNKSWAHPLVKGYEIKIARSDFINDDKWHGYLPYCNEFYFICPYGIIKPEELPDEVGLMYISKTGNRLYTKKKAPRRDVTIPPDLFIYILMCRSTIGTEYHSLKKDNIKYWKNWLKEKDEKKELGYNVSENLRKIIKERIKKVDDKNTELEHENRHLQQIKEHLQKIGLDFENVRYWNYQNTIDERIKEIESGIPDGFLDQIDSTVQSLMSMKKIFVEAKQGKEEEK